MHRLWAFGRRISSTGGGISSGSFAIWARHFAARAHHRRKPAKARRIFGEPPPRPTGQPVPKHERPRQHKPKFSLQAAQTIVEGWDKMAIRLGLEEEGSDHEDEEEQEVGRRSTTERKRDAIRAFQMARLLATFTRRQIKDAVKFAFLPQETLQATLLVQQMKVDGLRGAKSRQYKYIARLIRKSEIDLVEFVFSSLRDGHTDKLRKVMESLTTKQRDKQVKLAAERWLQGLVTGDKAVVDEVYALPAEHLDKSRLRELLRNVKVQASSNNKSAGNDPLARFMHRDLWRARKALTKVLEAAADYDLRARQALPKQDPSKLEELEDMEAEAFLPETASPALVSETAVREANVMVERAVRQEPEALAMVVEEDRGHQVARCRTRDVEFNDSKED